MSMQGKLHTRLGYLNPTVRARVIKDVLDALVVPSPFMQEMGGSMLRKAQASKIYKSDQDVAARVFTAMIDEAKARG
jgi:hypothetical protein